MSYEEHDMNSHSDVFDCNLHVLSCVGESGGGDTLTAAEGRVVRSDW